MYGLEKVLTEERSNETVQVQEASSDPHDVDSDGIEIVYDEMTVASPALEPMAPIAAATAGRRRRRARGG
jgi:hypothetical protein